MKNSHLFLKALLLVLVLAFVCWSEKTGTSQENPGATAQFSSREPRLVVQMGHAGAVTAVAFSSDGRLVVTAGGDRAVILWKASSGREIRRLAVDDEVKSVAFTPNGYIISTKSEKAVTLWSAETGKKITVIGCADSQFSSDGRLLLTDHNTAPTVYKALTGEQVYRYPKPGDVEDSTFSPDGRFVLFRKKNKTATLWNVRTGTEERQFDGAAAKFSPDGRFVITRKEEIVLWNAGTGELIRRFAGGHAEVSPDGRSVVTSIGKEARFGNKPMNTNPSEILGESVLFESSTGKELRRFTGNAAAFSPDGKLIETTVSEKPALWDAATGQMLRRLDDIDSDSNITFSADGRHFLTVGSDNVSNSLITVWDTRGVQRIHQSRPVTLEAIAFSPDSRYVLAGDSDRSAGLWELATGSEVRRFEGLTPSVDGVRFTNDGQLIEMNSVINSKDPAGPERVSVRTSSSSVHQWEVATGQRRTYFQSLSESVHAAAVSSNGRFVVTGGEKIAQLWEVPGGRFVRSFEGHAGPITSMRLSHDDRILLTASTDGTARLWDVASGRELRRFFGHTEDTHLWSELSRDGRFVLTAGFSDGTVRLWDAATGGELRQFLKAGEDTKFLIMGIAFSPDGRFVLASVSEFLNINSDLKSTATARLWEAATGKEVRRFEHPDLVTSVAFSPDGRRVLTGCADARARLWNASSGTPIKSFTNPFATTAAVVFSPDGRRILVSGVEALSSNISRGFRACLWDAKTGRVLKSFVSPATDDLQPVFITMAVAFSADGRSVITVSQVQDTEDMKSLTEKLIKKEEVEAPRSAQLWDVATGKQIRSFGRDEGTPQEIELSPDGKTAIVRSRYFGAVQLMDAVTGQEVRRFTGPTQAVTDIAYSPDGSLVLAGSEDGTTYLWEKETGKLLHRFAEFSSEPGTWDDEITGITFSADQRFVGFILDYEDPILADAATGHLFRKVHTGTGPPEDRDVPLIDCAAISPDGNDLALGEFNGDIIIIDRQDQQQRLDAHYGHVTAIKFSPDGRLLATAGEDKSVTLWDLETYKEVHELWPDGGADCIEFSPNGRLLLTGGPTTTRLWNVKNGSVVRELKQSELVTAAAFSGDGQIIATGGKDGTVTFWNARTGTRLRTMKGHTDMVIALAFSPNGRLVVSAGEDNAVHSWDVVSGVRAATMSVQRKWGDPMALSSDAHMVVTGGEDKIVRLWDVRAGKEAREVINRFHQVNSATFSSDGRFVLTGSTEYRIPKEQGTLFDIEPAGGSARLWDVTTKTLVHSFGSEFGSQATFSPNGKYLLTKLAPDPSGHIIAGAKIWETATGKELREFKFDGDGVAFGLTMSGDARQILASGIFADTIDDSDESPSIFYQGNKARLFDTETRKVIHTLTGHTAKVGSVAISPDGKYLLTASDDGTTGFWNAKTGKLICRLILFRDGTWIVVTPDGRFDTNSLERIEGLHWVMADDPLTALPVEIFMRPYYEPRLLPRLLSEEDFREVPSLGELNRVQPKVTITGVQQDGPVTATVTVEVENVAHTYEREKDRIVESGAKDLRLFRDGQLVGYRDGDLLGQQQSANGRCEPIAGSAKKCKAVFEHIRLPRQEGVKDVQFSAYAFNTSNVKSETFRYRLTYTPELPARKGRVYLITVGASNYENSDWNLEFAANDAHLIDETLVAKLRETGDYEGVISIILTSEERVVNGTREFVKTATKDNFGKIMRLLAGEKLTETETREIPNAQQIEKATPEDVVLIFYSSHGYRDEERFYLFPYDIGQGTGRDPEAVAPQAISSDDLYRWLRDIDAGDTVLVIDACHAAAVTGKDFKPGPMGSRGMGQLAYDKGMRILAATQPDTVAAEVDNIAERKKIRHGLLTYALVEDGLIGCQADSNGDKLILLAEWLEYGVTGVPRLYAEAVKQQNVGAAPGPVTKRGPNQVRFISRGEGDASTQQPSLFDFSSKLRKKRQLVVSRS